MKASKTLLLAGLLFLIFLWSCTEEDPTPNSEDPITILGKWFFKASSVEIISIQSNSEITIPTPDFTDNSWTFFENDSALFLSSDTSYTAWYHYDTANSLLEFEDGFYDVQNHTKDSLSLRFYHNIIVAEFYTYFELIR